MKKKGINLKLVDSNNYTPAVEEQAAQDAISQMPDIVRYFGGAFWTAQNGNLVQNSKDMFYNIETEGETVTLQANKNKFIDENSFINGVLLRKFDETGWSSFAESILSKISGATYYDFYTDFSKPVNLSEVDKFPAGANFISKEFVYNFYVQEFESLVGSTTFDISTLPTAYDVINKKILDRNTENENLVLGLGGLVSDESIKQLVLATDSVKVQTYYTEYARAYEQSEARPVINRIKRFPKNKLLDPETIYSLNVVEKNFIQFPFYMSAVFSNLSNTVSSDFIHILRKYGNLQQDLYSYLSNILNVPTQSFILQENILSAQDIPYYNLKNWLDINLKANVSVGDAYDTSATAYVRYTDLVKYIKDNIKPKIRKYSDLKNSANYDVLFYKVEKRQFNYTSSPIQTFYLTPTENDIIKFIDTQIKYGESYYYTISAVTLVYGNAYSYSNYYDPSKQIEKARDIKSGKYKLKVKNNIEYRIFEIPYAKFSGAAREAPLTKPNISFQLVNDKPVINIKQSPHETLENFESIERNETELFENIRISQDNSQADKIYSKNYGTWKEKRLQIYKLAERPMSYHSFRGRLMKQLILSPNANTIIDDLIPNKKYYYLFRYLNEHGTPSNASDIHEVILREEDSYMYIEDKIYQISPEYERNLIKNMKRYVLLRPSANQVMPNMANNPQDINDIVLGPDGKKVWNKPFTMTIRSKKSGRVLKYHFKFNLDR
jgi:hypothetical protein